MNQVIEEKKTFPKKQDEKQWEQKCQEIIERPFSLPRDYLDIGENFIHSLTLAQGSRTQMATFRR